MTDVHIASDVLGGSALSLHLQQGVAPEWLAPAPASPDEWRRRAEARRGEGDWASRWSALEPAFNASGAAAERLARVRREGGVVVTTGQQPGLFGGPIYTWSKAVSAIALADALEAALGIPVAPVFWAATDDADFAEASFTALAAPGGVELVKGGEAPRAGTPMSRAPLGELAAQLASLARAAGSVADPRALQAVRDAYGRPGETVGTAFVELMRALLAPLGMPVLDASHPAVASASRGTLELALARAPMVEQALRERAAAIVSGGFAPQVEDVPGLSLVFTREDGVKRRLAVAEGVSGPLKRWTTLTPNVLLRPVVERAILPTVAYVAGPGELAYFAQVSAVSQALGVDAPVAVPRWSCTLLEPHVRTLLERFGVTPAGLADPMLWKARWLATRWIRGARRRSRNCAA